MPSAVPDEGFSVILKIGVEFKDDQLTDKGWFLDTDKVEERLDDCCTYLGSNTWTAIFKFRPTFELVAKWAYDMLENSVPGLVYVTLDNDTLGVSTTYRRSQG